MYFETHIAYAEQNQLATAYNTILERCQDEWVLILDHDVFLTNPVWYDMCVNAINQLSGNDKVVAITCYAGGENKKGMPHQSSDIAYHIKQAELQYRKHGNKLEKIDQHAAGFFLLLNVKNARKIGFEQQGRGINNIDREFGKKALAKGFEIWRMKGLYVYHRRGMSKLRKTWLQ